ncbi:MAG: GNAT family N-acetyltransferase [Bacteroidia bacterium]
MNIRYLKNEDLNTAQWDACIQESMPSLLYAYSWYLDLVCEDWDALVLGDYEAVMPIPFTRKLGFKIALQPPFCQQLGVFSRSALNESIVHAFLAAIPSQFRGVKLNLNYHNPLNSGVSQRSNYVLDLMPDMDALKTHFESSVLRNVRKSEKTSCALLEGVDIRSIMELVTWQNKDKNMGLSKRSLRKLERLIPACTQKGVLISIGLYSPINHLCAVGIFLKDKQRLYYLFGASDEMGREYSGMTRIMLHLIEKFVGQGYTLDFEGSEIPGIARFFKKFGAKNSPYPVYSRQGFIMSCYFHSKNLILRNFLRR